MSETHEQETPPASATSAASTSVEEFLALVADQAPGWSNAFGGPAGIVHAVDELQARIKVQQEQLRAVRGAAFQHLLDERRSLNEVATQFGISGQAVWKAARYDSGQVQTW